LGLDQGLNWDLTRSLNGLAGRAALLDSIAVIVATDLVFLILLAVVVWWFVPRSNGAWQHAALAALGALVCGQILNLIIGHFVFVPRPFVAHSVQLLIPSATDSSFPSDHATAAFTVAGTALLRELRGRWLVTICAILVAIARVYVGAHYPADVIAGAALGFVWSVVFFWLEPWLSYPYSLTIGFARRIHLA
jgi:undecaprenyl-diphosphatase